MKLPKNFPNLKDPKFILANPVWLQVGVLVLVFAIIISGIIFAFRAIVANTAHFYHYIILTISVIGLLGVFYPRNWRRLVGFAADINGVYFCNIHGDYTFIPWKNVGESSIGIVGGFKNKQKTVILKIRVDNETWERVRGGKTPKLLQIFDTSGVDGDGYRSVAIGNAARNVHNTQREIEQLRSKTRELLQGAE